MKEKLLAQVHYIISEVTYHLHRVVAVCSEYRYWFFEIQIPETKEEISCHKNISKDCTLQSIFVPAYLIKTGCLSNN